MQQVINMSNVFSHLFILMPNQTVMKTEQDPRWGLEGGVRVMKQVIGSTWLSERPMFVHVHVFFNVFTYCDQCLDYAGPRDVVSCVKVFVFTETGGFIAFNNDKNIKNVLLLCSPQDAQYQKCMKMSDCEMLKMNSYIDIKCCSGDLCNTFDESA